MKILMNESSSENSDNPETQRDTPQMFHFTEKSYVEEVACLKHAFALKSNTAAKHTCPKWQSVFEECSDDTSG